MKLMNISEQLLQIRKDYQLKQAELAEILGESPQNLSRWEHGNGCPSYEKLCVLSYLFDKPIEELLNYAHHIRPYQHCPEIKARLNQRHRSSAETSGSEQGEAAGQSLLAETSLPYNLSSSEDGETSPIRSLRRLQRDNELLVFRVDQASYLPEFRLGDQLFFHISSEIRNGVALIRMENGQNQVHRIETLDGRTLLHPMDKRQSTRIYGSGTTGRFFVRGYLTYTVHPGDKPFYSN